MKLPHPERAIVEIEKIAGYCLNPEHPEGKHKARVFKSALNLDLDNTEELQAALLQAVATYDAREHPLLADRPCEDSARYANRL